MGVGDLSADQARYVAAVVDGTGLDRSVVVAWIGAESGWGVTKPSHNYLNVGPGRNYASTDQAAQAVVGLIRNSSHYAGIRAAIATRNPLEQVRAIQDSPWDAAHYGGNRLELVWSAVTGHGDFPGPIDDLETPAELVQKGVGAVVDPVIGAVGSYLSGFADSLVRGLLTTVFVTAGLGLIALGLNRLTGTSASEQFGRAQELLGVAQTAAKAI